VDRVRSAGIEMSFSGINESVMKVLKRTHLLAKIGEQNIFPTTEKAVCAIHERAHRGGDEKTCPLTAVCRIS
jgi:SulP family sulfate permease